MNTYERRRVALAVILTAIALPALWWAKRDNPISSPSVAAIDGGQAVDAAAAANIASENDPPGYLSGPSVEIPPLVAEPTGPPAEESFTRAGLGTYRNFSINPDPAANGDQPDPYLPSRLCEVNFLPIGTRITVENTDNGKQIKCIVNRGRLDTDITIVMDSTLFVQLADMADAPIPVRIRW